MFANVRAAAGRQLDLVVVAEDWVEPALLAADDRRVEMPAGCVVEEVDEACGTAAGPALAHLDIRRVES